MRGCSPVLSSKQGAERGEHDGFGGFGELQGWGQLRDIAPRRPAPKPIRPLVLRHVVTGALFASIPAASSPGTTSRRKTPPGRIHRRSPAVAAGFTPRHGSRRGRREGKTRCIHPTQPKLRGGGGCAAGGRQGLRFPRLFLPVLIFSAAA